MSGVSSCFFATANAQKRLEKTYANQSKFKDFFELASAGKTIAER
jgi:hypothetical protein